MLEMAELRPQTAKKPRQRPGHAQLLRMRLESERLDAFGHELGMPGDGREAQVRGSEREAAQ